MPDNHPTYIATICNSPQWQAWVKHNEETPQWDVYESMECGWLSEGHWQAFLAFNETQQTVKGINQAIAYLRKTGEMKAANKLEKGIVDGLK